MHKRSTSQPVELPEHWAFALDAVEDLEWSGSTGLLDHLPPIELARTGRRVRRIGGQLVVTTVVEPDLDDPTILYSASREAAIAEALERGLVVETVLITALTTEQAFERATEMVRQGRTFGEVDTQLARWLGMSERSARRLRQSWGLSGPPRTKSERSADTTSTSNTESWAKVRSGT